MFRLFLRNPAAETIDRLYGAIVAQARDPAFYTDYQVPDTVEGRFDMLVLHLFLFARRSGRELAPIRAVSQAVFDRFCRDIDHNLREMGVGDLAIPRRMRRVGEAFYGRTASYEAALALEQPDALAQALARNVYGVADGQPRGARRLAAYVRAADASLSSQPGETLVEAGPRFPAPASIESEA